MRLIIAGYEFKRETDIIGLNMTLIQLEKLIAKIVAGSLSGKLDLSRLNVSLTADAKHGDYATNAAMVYAKDLGRTPREVAEELAQALKAASADIEKVEVAGPGFINISLSNQAVARSAQAATTREPVQYAGKTVVAEYSDPNPFKVLHVGHLYTSVVGDAIANLIETAGGTVHRVNFGGDVGLHVAKTMWAILGELGDSGVETLDKIPEETRSDWMAKAYVAGTRAYDEASEEGHDPQAKLDILQLNRIVYDVWNLEAASSDSYHNIAVADVQAIYRKCRKWSYEYFDAFYARIGTKFEKYYPESEVAPLGLATVRKQLKLGVYKDSAGAVVFEGEPYGLHTRVFITSQGLPTYEAKDTGLLMTKWQDYHFDRSVVITGNDIIEYMKVVLKSVEQFEPELVARTVHLTHGNVKLAGNEKMSSRKGNFLRAVDVLELAGAANKAANGHDDERVVLGAVKYSFLKQRIGADLVFIPEESVSLDGNSGPYLQYAHARARSILAKAGKTPVAELAELDSQERVLALKISEYADVVERSVDELMPHYIATYLYELAQIFNRFYEGSRVIGDVREAERLQLVKLYADVLGAGLAILGIEAPDRL
jgi:arginyl-tRNA synthetase